MNSRFTVVETSLNRAEFRWKWLKFLQHSFTLGGIVALLVLLFGWAMAAGWVTSRALATTFFAVLAVAGFIAWIVIIIGVAIGSPDRNWLAAAVERVDRRLLDRLNTLLFLERRRGQPHADSFSLRIAKQTQRVLAEKKPDSPFAGTRALAHMAGFLAIAIATGLIYQHYAPWKRLLAAENKKAAAAQATPEKPLELALPATNNVEQNLSWGEVRITDPGADLRVTKVDVVPLHIEAAANQALKAVNWFSTVNGAEETPHELDAPKEPRYAVYQPNVYLDELGLSDWDVMTYYAKANTEKENSFASEVYFMEVRPFREDILKLPGGEGGKAYECLNEMTALINRQQQVIRQTHLHIQRPPEQENLRSQDRKKLAEAEADLGDSAEHLYAKMASKMENKPIGDALDNLAKAEKSLGGASKLLQNNSMNEAPNRERTALSELVAARKAFQKSVSENPKEFEDSEEEPPPVADASKRLNEMTEFRNESKAAQGFVQKALAQQKSLEQKAKTAPRSDYAKLSDQEQKLQQSLKDFQQQHPKAFKGSEAESQNVEQAMTKAADSLQKKSNEARNDTHEATGQLEQLSEAMNSHSAEQQLADAYRLKQMLDKQIDALDQRTKPDSKISDAELQATAKEARETINQLKKAAEQEPTKDAFGEPLRESLNGQNKVDLDAKLNQLQQAQDEASKQQQSGEARDGLSKVSKAFTQSQPKALQMAQQSDSLKQGDQDSFNRGMAELDSLVKQAENKRPVSRSDQAKQGQEALFNLQNGMRSHHGHNERGNQILVEMNKMLKAEAPLEVENLKKLMEELQHFSVETSDKLAQKEDKPEVSNIDPAKLPPAYRGRIQKYFQRLSEK
jgi:hypothetical protein